MLMPMENLVWILAFVGSGLSAGVLSGLFGVGGGTLVVPLLLLLGIPIHHAVGMSLVYIVFASASGSVKHYRQDNIHLASALWMSAAAFFTSFVGVKIGVALPAQWLSFLFSGLMLLVLGIFAYRLHLEKKQGQQTWEPDFKPPLTGLMTTGLIAGVFSSLFGVGGGFVMVPLLVILARFNLKKAAGTSLVAIFFIGLTGILQHYLFGDLKAALHDHLWPMVAMALAGVVGAPLGAMLNHKLPARWLHLGFMAFILAITVYMFFYGQQA